MIEPGLSVRGDRDTYPTGIGSLVLAGWASCSLLTGCAVPWLQDAQSQRTVG